MSLQTLCGSRTSFCLTSKLCSKYFFTFPKENFYYYYQALVTFSLTSANCLAMKSNDLNLCLFVSWVLCILCLFSVLFLSKKCYLISEIRKKDLANTERNKDGWGERSCLWLAHMYRKLLRAWQCVHSNLNAGCANCLTRTYGSYTLLGSQSSHVAE